MRKAAIFANAAVLAAAVGCHSLSNDASPPEYVYAHGFVDHVAATGPELARELALFRAQQEAAKLQAVRGIQFTYRQLGNPESLTLDFVGQTKAAVAGSKRVGDSLWVAVQVQRSADVLTLMEGMPVARATATVRREPLGEAYNQALRSALAQVIERFAAKSNVAQAEPLHGRLTLVSLDVAPATFGGLRVAVEANVDFATSTQAGDSATLSLEQAQRLREAGDKQAAAAMLRELIKRTPTVAKYYEELGNVYCDMEQFGQACWEYGMAASFDPTNPEYHLAMGEAYQFMGNRKEAERAYAKAIQVDPTCAAARTALRLLRTPTKPASAQP